MRVLIDTNIVLDFLLERELFVEAAARLFQAIELCQIEGYVAATTLTNIFYIVKKAKGKEVAERAVRVILGRLQICAVDKTVLERAVHLSLSDFEDAVQLACAISYNLNGIVTRDIQGFIGSPLPVWSADECCNYLQY